jgi:NAD(P)-dependent dehydrogenase (short-subunit alcohol dehydrogenase family)
MTTVSTKAPIILVTGSTDGIGRTTAELLAARGARVIVHGRNRERAEALTAELRARGAEPLEPVIADFSRFADVRALVQTLEARAVSLDVLLNNAGVFCNDLERAEGHEKTFTVNHLAPYLLTQLVLASPVGVNLRRVVNVSSVAHQRGDLRLDDLDFAQRGFGGYATYAASKLANVVFSCELARRLASRHIDVNALHPGVVSTKLLTEGFRMEGPDSLEDGAKTSVRLALDADVAGHTGGYYVAGVLRPHHAKADDLAFARAFYERSAEIVGVTPA